jgi:hypothetical protein
LVQRPQERRGLPALREQRRAERRQQEPERGPQVPESARPPRERQERDLAQRLRVPGQEPRPQVSVSS